MCENVFAVLTADAAKPLGIVKPLHCSLFHSAFLGSHLLPCAVKLGFGSCIFAETELVPMQGACILAPTTSRSLQGVTCAAYSPRLSFTAISISCSHPRYLSA